MGERTTRGEEPLKVTDKALKWIKHLADAEKKKGYGLRVKVAMGGCAGLHYHMALEKDSEPGDDILASGGVKIFLDKGSKKFLEGAEIDFVESVYGSRLVINNPNVEYTCTCGQSFSV